MTVSRDINKAKNFYLGMALFIIVNICLAFFMPYWTVNNTEGLIGLDITLYIVYNMVWVIATWAWYCCGCNNTDYVTWKAPVFFNIIAVCFSVFRCTSSWKITGISSLIGLGSFFVIFGLVKLFTWDLYDTLDNIKKHKAKRVYVLENN